MGGVCVRVAALVTPSGWSGRMLAAAGGRWKVMRHFILLTRFPHEKQVADDSMCVVAGDMLSSTGAHRVCPTELAGLQCEGGKWQWLNQGENTYNQLFHRTK